MAEKHLVQLIRRLRGNDDIMHDYDVAVRKNTKSGKAEPFSATGTTNLCQSEEWKTIASI